MRYIKRLVQNVSIFRSNRLSTFEKLIYSCLCILFVITLIVYFFEKYFYLSFLISFIVIGSGIYLWFRRFRIHRQDKKRDLDGINTRLGNNTKIISGNYNESIGGHYIQGDYINIQEKSIDISQDINQILVEIQSILIKLENQGYSIEDAKAQIANELAEEVRRKPKIKNKFGFDEDADENDEAEALINLLVANSYFANPKPSRIHTYLDEDENYEDRVSYKGHTIYLEVDKDGRWHYRIDGLLIDYSGWNYFKPLAIDEAKGKIDEERFSDW